MSEEIKRYRGICGLCAAVLSCEHNEVKKLLEEGVDVNGVFNTISPIHGIVFGFCKTKDDEIQRLKIFNLMLEYGVDLTTRTAGGNNLMDLVLGMAHVKNLIPLIQVMLEAGAPLPSQKIKYVSTDQGDLFALLLSYGLKLDKEEVNSIKDAILNISGRYLTLEGTMRLKLLLHSTPECNSFQPSRMSPFNF